MRTYICDGVVGTSYVAELEPKVAVVKVQVLTNPSIDSIHSIALVFSRLKHLNINAEQSHICTPFFSLKIFPSFFFQIMTMIILGCTLLTRFHDRIC